MSKMAGFASFLRPNSIPWFSLHISRAFHVTKHSLLYKVRFSPSHFQPAPFQSLRQVASTGFEPLERFKLVWVFHILIPLVISPATRFVHPICTSSLKSGFLYTTACLALLFEHLIRISNLLCPTLSSWHSLPPNCIFLIAHQLIKWRLQFFRSLSQKPYNHPWLHSFSHTQHAICQQSLLAPSSKYTLKLTTLHHCTVNPLVQPLSYFTWIITIIF